MGDRELGIIQPGPEDTVEVLTSPDGLADFTERLSANLKTSCDLDAIPYDAFRIAMSRFLGMIYRSPHVASVAVSHRKFSLIEPIVDIGVLWSSISEGDHTYEIETLFREHSVFWSDVRPYIDSFLAILSPARYPTTEELKKHLEGDGHTAIPRTLLGIVKFEHTTSNL